MQLSKNFYRIWRRVLIRTLPVLLIPLLLTVFICDVSIHRIIESTYESQLQNLQSGVNKAERILNNASDLILFLENETDCKQFMASTGPMKNGKSTLDFIDLQNNLHSLIVSNSLFAAIQLYSLRSDALIDSSTTSLVPRRYYEHVFQISDVSFSDWSEQYLHASYNLDILPARKCTFYSREDDYVIVAHSFPTGYTRYTSGSAFIYIKESTLLNNAFDSTEINGAVLCAVNAGGETVFQNQPAFQLDTLVNYADLTDSCGYSTLKCNGESMLLVYAAGAQYGLRYFSVIPMEHVLAPTISVRTTITILMALFVIIGLGMIAFCTARLSRPVSNLYDLVVPSRQVLSFDDFSGSVHSLISQNENLQEQISQQSVHYRMAMVYNLFLGNADGGMTSDACCRELGIERTYPVYAVITLVLNDIGEYSEQNLGIKMYIREALQSNLSGILALCDWGCDKIVLLLGLDTETKEQAAKTLNERIGQFSANLNTGFAISLTFFGDLCCSLEEISLAFHHTLATLQRADKDISSVVQWYRPAESPEAAFIYPIELESQLIASTLGGNPSVAEKCFDEVRALNQTESGKPGGITEDLLLALRSSWLRLCGESDGSVDSRPVLELVDECLRTQGDRAVCLSAIRGVFVETAQALGRKENAAITENQRQIQAYVDANFTNPDMSLTLVADEFHISEVYLSKLFKQIAGVNFAKYIEQLRMERANELLKEQRPIKDIALEVGYNSPQVFRRAYKRLYGTSPSDRGSID